ncbi:plasmid stabilization protein [Peribacillus simplex]|uniref:plasmid stabilization protein n=1 Tax=Peribacillus simplex TaxID=1478 RepID=UPI0025A1577D|nr:plasmid stabilization protein [Peribacillus simplex]MDM5292018.1 plasmid stabilization protein [Peribacillus simplex]
MPHKMTVTGKPVGPLCQKGSFYTFDMEESGSPSSPKGLPGGSTITYTVFLNQKQLQKAGLTAKNINQQKIMVQGEPTLDVSVDDCPGEIGLICFQVSILPEKPEKKETSKPVKIQAEEKPKAPKGTEDFLERKAIVVPEAFLNSHPNPEKTQQVVNYVKQTGHLDEPLTINRETNMLTDGYRRYIVAQQLELEIVPVIYEKETASVTSEKNT